MSDIYTHYETGVQELLRRLGRGHPSYSTALVYQQRLTENLAAARAYGDTREREAGRAEILHRLNGLAQSALGVTFAELCPPPNIPPAATPPPEGAPVYHINSGGGAVVMGNVSTSGGDFVGHDSTRAEAAPRTSTPPGGTSPVNTAALRARLQRLDDVQLETLCMDHFPDVYDQFGRGLRRDEKVNLLLAHCRRNPAGAARLLAITKED